jgi:uncharacterized protein (UPF0276 family)
MTAGVSLKAQHYAEAAAAPARGLWFEAHPENYMVAGGPRLAWLEVIRQHRPLSLHGVALSLAADADPDKAHLSRLKALIDRFEPALISEHLAWSAWDGTYRPDLLPFPRTGAALRRIAANIARAQDALGRAILIENPALYLDLPGHDYGEADFLAELVRRTGCGLLVDVNNAHVSGTNLGYDPGAYLDALPAEAIGEIHLAGHTPDARLGRSLLIDSHAEPVAQAVWSLYQRLIDRIGAKPTLIERDEAIPAFDVLMTERDRAEGLLRTRLEADRAGVHV